MNAAGMTLTFVTATTDDAALLGGMNLSLVRDEGHRSRMSADEMTRRMAGWLANHEYQAILFRRDEQVIGYALYRVEAEWVYLRQLYVHADYRRRGVGRAALQWMRDHCWQGAPRVRMDVLVDNPAGIAFWRSVGFVDYCLTMEIDLASDGGSRMGDS